MKTVTGSLLFLVTLLASCSMAHLDRYPGVKQDSVPAVLRGAYYLKIKQNSQNPNDSIAITINKDGWSYKEGNKGEEYLLSDKTVLSKIDGYYVISLKDNELRQYWNSWVIVNKNKKLELYPIVSITHKPSSDKLTAYLKKNLVGLENKPDSAYYYEMNDGAFIRYFEKEIKGSKTFEIIRINNKK